MTGGGDRNKLSLNSGVSYIFTHTHTLKKKNPQIDVVTDNKW